MNEKVVTVVKEDCYQVAFFDNSEGNTIKQANQAFRKINGNVFSFSEKAKIEIIAFVQDETDDSKHHLEEKIYRALVFDNPETTLKCLAKVELTDLDMYPLVRLGEELKKNESDNPKLKTILGNYVFNHVVDWDKIAQGVVSYFQELTEKFVK